MIEKQCSKCNKILSIENFSRHHIMKDGYRNTCRLCCKKYKQDNKTNLAIKDKVAKKLHYLENKEFYQKRNKLYYQSNKENIILLNKKWKENNKERYEKMKKQHYINNKSIIAANCKLYYQNNKEKRNLYVLMRKQNDVSFKLTCNLRTRISRVLRNKIKTGSAIQDLGCSAEFLKQHLEAKFQLGMTWDNYGRTGWHVDHIKPLASFDLQDLKQFKEACHYTNLQPLWAKDNISKSDKIVE